MDEEEKELRKSMDEFRLLRNKPLSKEDLKYLIYCISEFDLITPEEVRRNLLNEPIPFDDIDLHLGRIVDKIFEGISA